MADKQPDVVKTFRKRRKNKSAKRKSNKNFPSNSSEKFNSSIDKKDFSTQDLSKNDSYEENSFIFTNNQNKQQESSSINDVVEGRANKHHSQNFGINGVSSRPFRNRYGKQRINDSTEFTNRYTRNSYPASNDFQCTPEEIEFLNTEINFLRQENLRLRNDLQELQYYYETQSCSGEVIFQRKPLPETFSFAVSKLIKDLLSGKIQVEELEKFCDEPRKSPEPLDECLFALDSSADLSLNTSIPVYDASFQQILEKVDDTKNATPQKTSGSGRFLNCFNCDEDHHMSKCPYKKDFRRIANAKRQAKSSYIPSVRYHVHGKNENYFKPGSISEELREALGLENNRIPEYIYRMRVLDYPPGWLYEAAVESSGMVLYDSEGNVLREENCEDGEVDTSEVRVQYDPDKLIDYPGFNVPLPPNIIEESETFGLPPLQPNQLRTFVEKFMSKPNVRPSRKRKINLSNDKPRKIQRLEEDMEIEDDSDNDGRIEITNDFVPPLPESAPAPPPPPPPPPADGVDTPEDTVLSSAIPEENSASLSDFPPNFSKIISCSDFESGASSPSLAELEEIKKKLVMQLDNSGDEEPYEPSADIPLQDESSSNVNIDDDKFSEILYVSDECVGSDLSNLSSLSNSDSLQDKSDAPESSLNRTGLQDNTNSSQDKSYSSHSLERTNSQSKCVALGTPSLACHSPFTKLPAYEKFSKDVSDHLPFENLPNSTGTYEKMKNVLKKVKAKLNSFMN